MQKRFEIILRKPQVRCDIIINCTGGKFILITRQSCYECIIWHSFNPIAISNSLRHVTVLAYQSSFWLEYLISEFTLISIFSFVLINTDENNQPFFKKEKLWELRKTLYMIISSLQEFKVNVADSLSIWNNRIISRILQLRLNAETSNLQICSWL